VPGKGCRMLPLRSDPENYVRHVCVMRSKGRGSLELSAHAVWGNYFDWCFSRVSYLTEK